MRQIALDTETTGLSVKDGHRVIEIGCCEIVNRKVTNKDFHFYINPKRDIDLAAKEIHGITEDFLSDKPVFIDIIDELMQYIQDAQLIIHNASFDISFLDYEFNLAKQPITMAQSCSILDTLLLARRKHPGKRNDLNTLCDRYQVDRTARDYHGALLDAKLLAEVYLLMTAGGQAQLFEEQKQADNTVEKTKVVCEDVTFRASLPIIKPDVSEKKAHDAFLAMMEQS